MDAALSFARRDLNQPLLEYSETDHQLIERAAAAADRGEQFQRLYDEELAGACHAGALVRLSGEIRLCEKQTVDFVARIHLGAGPAKSQRHQRSAELRWHRDGA
jgi:hypothetical protein